MNSDYLSARLVTPFIIWPKNRRWCASLHEDLATVYIGCDSNIAEKIVQDRRLEVLPISPDQGIAWDSDRVNPLPGPPEL